MSHAVNPTGFRAGKQSHFWSHNSIATINNKQSAQGNEINLPLGLEATANSLLRRNNYWTVKSSTKFDNVSGVTKLNVLYYPLVVPILRKRIFPTYCAPRNLLSKPSSYTKPFKKVIAKIWSSKNRAFNDRFIRSKARVNLNKLVMKSMFRGTKLFRGLKPFIHKKSNSLFSKYLANKFLHYSIKSNRWARWRMSSHRINSRLLSKQLSKRVGSRIQIKAMNVFTYLLKKTKVINFGVAQRRIWNKRYHFYKRRFTAYYDIVNSLFLLCHIPFSEKLLVRMIQYGLSKMHRRKIRPKNFFYFINTVVKNMPEIKKKFNAFRIVITGKLRGGTSRTTQFSAGFGVIPLQTIKENIKYEFGNVRSKYGSFGVKLYTWRKSVSTQLESREMKWVLYFKKRKFYATNRKVKNKKMFSNENKLKFEKMRAIVKAYHAYAKLLEVSAALKENKINTTKFNKILSSGIKLSKQSKLRVVDKRKQLRRLKYKLKLDKRNSIRVLLINRKHLKLYDIAKIKLAVLKNAKSSKVSSVKLIHQKLIEYQTKKISKIKLKFNIAKKEILAKNRRRAYFYKHLSKRVVKGKNKFGVKYKYKSKFANNKYRRRAINHKRFNAGNKNQYNKQAKFINKFKSKLPFNKHSKMSYNKSKHLNSNKRSVRVQN